MAPVAAPVAHDMTSTTFDLPGYRAVRSLGVVRGITVRSPHIGNQILGGLRTILGGEIDEYVKIAEQSRERAFEQLLDNAGQRGANAVLGVRYDANELMQNAAEVLAYGTAVVVEKI
jgi:uncharacterized protein YbjQ (UPF0145 family)